MLKYGVLSYLTPIPMPVYPGALPGTNWVRRWPCLAVKRATEAEFPHNEVGNGLIAG